MSNNDCDTCIMRFSCNVKGNDTCQMKDLDGIRTATEAKRAGVRAGVNAVLDFIGSMNMCDEISDEAYWKIMKYFSE